MSILYRIHKHIVAAAALAVVFSIPAGADAADDQADLIARLQQASAVDSRMIVREIRMKWDQSGSATVDLIHQRGKKALERQDFAEAVEHFTAAIDHAPGFAAAHYGRARALAGLQQAGPALADLEQALLLNANHFDAVYGMAVLLEQVERPALAYEAYALVLALNPHYDEAHAARARLEQRVKGQSL